jgi:hypothetical protein
MLSRGADRTAMAAQSVPLTAEQVRARERWQARWNLPILLAAFLPLFVTSPDRGRSRSQQTPQQIQRLRHDVSLTGNEHGGPETGSDDM